MCPTYPKGSWRWSAAELDGLARLVEDPIGRGDRERFGLGGVGGKQDSMSSGECAENAQSESFQTHSWTLISQPFRQ